MPVNEQSFAFPRPSYGLNEPAAYGMTKREYFAALAMQAMISNHAIFDNPTTDANKLIASKSFSIADAMIEESEKRHAR